MTLVFLFVAAGDGDGNSDLKFKVTKVHNAPGYNIVMRIFESNKSFNNNFE